MRLGIAGKTGQASDVSGVAARSANRNPIATFFDREGVAGYVFIAPWLIGFLAFVLYPMVSSLNFAFTDYDMISAPRWVGFANFIKMFTGDKIFLKSLGVTFFYTFVSVPLRLVFALMVAMLLVRPSKMLTFYRAAYYLPSLIGGSVAVAVLWRALFMKEGAINSLLRLIGLGGQTNWLSNEKTAIWTLIMLALWQFGSSMLIFLAGLKQIPVTYYEAAVVDGAGGFVKFFKITLPLLTPVIFFNLVMQFIGAFTAFTQCFVITNGDPMYSTLFYAVYVYRQAFNYYSMGYGSALAWFMLVIVAVFTALLFKFSSSWIYYETKVND